MAGAVRVDLHRLRLPLHHPHVAAHGTESERDLVLVAVTAADGTIGWGECSTLSRPGYTHEFTEGAWLVLRDVLGPALLAGRGVGVLGHPMAEAAMRTAQLDATLRRQGTSLATHLGATRPTVTTGAVVGLEGAGDDLVARVGQALDVHAALITCKIRPGADADRLGPVRATWPDLVLAADANGSYSRSDVETLTALDRFDLAYLEQPLAADDLVGSADLARRLDTPVALDESISSPGACATALALGAAGAVNLKPSRVGGPRQARAVHDLVVEAGAELWVGGMLESGVGRAAALAVAGLPGCTRPTDRGPSGRYWTDDVTEPVELRPDGTLAVPTGPGLGVTPRPDRLAELTVDHAVIT
ncbi:o-succinylbenzoate synthase [soil metagenome]